MKYEEKRILLFSKRGMTAERIAYVLYLDLDYVKSILGDET